MASGGDLDNSVQLEGGTDGTSIGNEGDCLKTEVCNPDDFPGGGDNGDDDADELRYEDIGSSYGGVSRGSSVSNSGWTTLYNQSGSGKLIGFLLGLESAKEWRIRLRIDGTDVFEGSTGLDLEDFEDGDIYGYKDFTTAMHLGFSFEDKIFRYETPRGVGKYSSSIEIRAKGAGKKFQGGLMVRTV